MVNSAFPLCRNDSRKSNGKSFHPFPKDENLCKQWLFNCKRRHHVNTKYARLCSDHFYSDDYEHDMRNIFGLPQRRILKNTAVPSRNINEVSESPELKSIRTARYNKGQIRQVALEHSKTLNPKKSRVDLSDYTAAFTHTNLYEEHSNNESGKCWAEEKAINYVAGYTAHKVEDQDTNLGEITKYITYENETWIATLSYGGLTEPTKEWKAVVRNFEEEFVQMHGRSLDRGKYVITRLKNHLEKNILMCTLVLLNFILG
ncbi:hypothetical protein AVEN_200333-1 [Araneus ventricosus]|uniref:THAP-type domain-containing protein n=1 Tax=Araneus ventricosus TaxID=182803 RepID=A0A4Y2PYY6_ARAVE|nr:hypothetical protein AVEN_200333-1 [Araneus ventricosus]